jgi:cyclohexadieny/prephenate dehydrogenase
MTGFASIAIIGVGLIGSSVARGIAAAGACPDVRLFDASDAVRVRAAGVQLPGRVCATLAEAVAGAELVILCCPPGAMGEVGGQLAPLLADGAVVSDVGSVKSAVVEAVLPALPDHCHFIPAHPIAGTEMSGPEAGFASLFHGRWAILCPLDDARPSYAVAVDRLSALWEALGSKVETMDPARHDMVLAMTSHLPHLIAFSVVATAEDLETVTESDVVKYSAGGFRDFTRIAASDPTMWRDVFLLNREAVLELLGRVSEDLTALRRAIRWGDGQMLFDTFTRARRMRREVIEAGQDVDQVNFGRTRE